VKNFLFLLALVGLLGGASAKEVVIDVRTPQEFAQDRIAGALNIDYTQIAQEIGKANVSKDDTVILYCRSGNRSGVALNTLKSMGYSKAVNYGGLEQARRLLQKP